MIFEDSFTVPATVGQAWELLNDVPAVAPCFPGAVLESSDGDEFRGSVRVKVGPVVAEYAGTAVMASRDVAARTVVIEAKGREKRGADLATATVTAVLTASGEGTRVDVSTDLRVSGRLAQFGSAVLQPVSAGLVSRFAANVRDLLAEMPPRSSPASAAPLSTAEVSAEAGAMAAVEQVESSARAEALTPEASSAEPVDLLRVVVGQSSVRRAAGAALLAGVSLLVVAVVVRRGRRG